MNEENVKTVEDYLNALKQRDLSSAPLADDLIFDNPVAESGTGTENFKAFLSGFLPAIKDIRIIRHVCEGEFVATQWEADTVFGVISIGEFFRVENGKITEITSYFDSKLIIS